MDGAETKDVGPSVLRDQGKGRAGQRPGDLRDVPLPRLDVLAEARHLLLHRHGALDGRLQLPALPHEHGPELVEALLRLDGRRRGAVLEGQLLAGEVAVRVVPGQHAHPVAADLDVARVLPGTDDGTTTRTLLRRPRVDPRHGAQRARRRGAPRSGLEEDAEVQVALVEVEPPAHAARTRDGNPLLKHVPGGDGDVAGEEERLVDEKGGGGRGRGRCGCGRGAARVCG